MTATMPTKRGTDFAQFVLLLLGGVVIALAGSFVFFPRTTSIWSDCGWVPTRYLSGEHGGCTILSHDEANNGSNRTVTSWTQAGMGLGPQPTPLAVGVKWDNPTVPASDPRGSVLVVSLAGFVGLTVAMGRWRRRTG